MSDKVIEVKKVFENTAQYLKYDYNLQIRKETVLSFTDSLHFDSILDMPCGTGAMSIPLLNQTNKLTLIDISTNMLAIAQKAIPESELKKVETINDDFFNLNIQPQSYDLIICLGLLAHVNSPKDLLNKLSHLLKPGGILIIQNTDSKHFYSHLIRFYLGLKNLMARQTYRLNKVPGHFVINTLLENGLTLEKQFRYNQSFLGLSNLFSNEKKYTMTRNFFGDVTCNKNASLGSDSTYLFKKRN